VWGSAYSRPSVVTEARVENVGNPHAHAQNPARCSMLHLMDTPRETLRLFFALWPSAEDASRIMAWARAAHDLCGGRIMRPETLHLTLAFLGATPASQAAALIEAAPGWPAPVAPLALAHFGRFIGPRIVWAGPSGEGRIRWLDALYDDIWARLVSMGWARPAGVFRPHVSLLRRAGPCELGGLSQPPLVWTPAQCVLVASQPAESGSYYRVVARMPLQAAGAQ